VDVLLSCALGFVFVIYGARAFWPGADDPEWERRWTGLDELDRTWLAAASRSTANRATLERRGELDLAKGFGRREARRRAYITLAIMPLFIVGAILVLGGLVGDRWAPLAFATFSFAQGLLAYVRDREIRERYREIQARYLAKPGAPAAPA
jgi:hypothetical protein